VGGEGFVMDVVGGGEVDQEPTGSSKYLSTNLL